MIAPNYRLLLVLAFSAGAIAAATAGSMGEPGGIGSLEAASDREISRRQEDLVVAEHLIKAGDQARSEKDIAKAYGLYKQAADMVPQGSAASGLRSRVISRFSSASIEYAQYLVGRGEYAEARNVATEVLEPRYNPDYKPAIAFLSHLEEADYFNKTVTPEFAAKRDEVQKLLQEAAGFYDSGRYDLATRRYRQTLGIDTENAAALRGLEQVELAKQRYYETAYNETRSRMLWQVEKAWARPVPTVEAMKASDGFEMTEDQRAGTVKMMNRLGEMTLDRVGPFTDASIQDVIAWFRRKSAELSPGGEEPINITLQLPSGAPAAPPDETGQTAAPSSTPALVTLELTDVPFYDALRYAATIANMKVRVDPYAVSVIPMSESSESLIMRTFKVPPDFLISGSGQEEAAPEAYAGSGPDEDYNARLKLRGGRPMQAEAFLRKKGVEFPDGSTATLAPGGTELVVRNTPSALEFIEAIVEAATLDRPTQVEIDAKFVEISQSNLKELGFDWTLGPFSIGGSGVFGTGGNTPNSTRAYPFVYPGSATPVGVDTATGGLRTGSGSLPYSAVTINSLNAVLAGQQLGSAGGPAPGIFSIAGIFTNPQFQVLIRALNQKKGVDLMAAPKVTAKSGQRAKINISREFPYPQEFDPPQIPQNTGGSLVSSTAPGVGVLNSTDTSDPIVTPSFPTDFTTRDLGVVLEVEPQVGADGREIELSLSPEVADFEGFINYGSPIYAAPAVNAFTGALDVATAGIISPQRQLLTENIINQPIFSTRKVTTNVSIWDGQTVALGGLIREDVQKVSDKVPILGDIPLAGVLFRSEVEQKIKRNLIIFVTARLIDAYGQPLRPEEDTEEEEMVEPLGLPPETPLPQRANPKGGLSRK